MTKIMRLNKKSRHIRNKSQKDNLTEEEVEYFFKYYIPSRRIFLQLETSAISTLVSLLKKKNNLKFYYYNLRFSLKKLKF